MWCANDKNGFFNSSLGQIDPTTLAGTILMNYVKKNNLNNIVDIGTWNGLGSTKCFLLALQDNFKTKFISLETNAEKTESAKKNLEDLLKNVNGELMCGSVINRGDITNLIETFPEIKDNTEFQRWHSIDLFNITKSNYLFDKIPEEIDFVLFDGGEFTTYYEFVKLFPRCKKFIALDDVNTSKCFKIREILKNHPSWTEVEYTPERGGFSIFKNISE
jgi:hypothetical protein